MDIADERFGGVSALALDRGVLIALTDSGTVIRFPMPGRGGRALVRDLPAGPGPPQFKVNRDSEALARDPAGRGWWVAFETWNQLWLYDPSFRRAMARVDLGKNRWRRNRGLEAIAAGAEGMLLLPESGREWLRLKGDSLQSYRLQNPFGAIADAARLPDGRLLLVSRDFGLTGIAKHVLVAEERRGDLAVRSIARIALGARDNVEAIAAEPRAGGGTRLWLLTDNDFRPRAPTLLVALDLP